MSKGLANVIEYAFQKQGRPNGYILGEEVGGAFVAGLRYGEGWLYTRDAGRHKVFWQGPSIGYDAGAEGSKVMVLVYNLRDPIRHLSPLHGRGRFRLCRWRRWAYVSDMGRCGHRADPLRHRPAAWCERGLFEVYPYPDMESVLN